MKIIAVVVALILCTGAFFQAHASCVTTSPVTTTKNKVRQVEENGKITHYEMYDEDTGEWFEAKAVGKDSHNLPIFQFTNAGKAAKKNHSQQDDLSGVSDGGGGGGGDGGGGGYH